MMMQLVVAAAIFTQPLIYETDRFCIEEYESYGRVYFDSGKIVEYDIKPGEWIHIDADTEEVTVYYLKDIFAWQFLDDDGQIHPMEEPRPDIKEIFDRKYNALAGIFYVSTDDPNVWIEVNDEDIGIYDHVFALTERA